MSLWNQLLRHSMSDRSRDIDTFEVMSPGRPSHIFVEIVFHPFGKFPIVFPIWINFIIFSISVNQALWRKTVLMLFLQLNLFVGILRLEKCGKIRRVVPSSGFDDDKNKKGV